MKNIEIRKTLKCGADILIQSRAISNLVCVEIDTHGEPGLMGVSGGGEDDGIARPLSKVLLFIDTKNLAAIESLIKATRKAVGKKARRG